jgi:hypothetical protein
LKDGADNLKGKELYNNGVWAIQKLHGRIPERPFEAFLDGKPMGMAKLLAFSWHVPNTDRYPQVLALYASGYLRLKMGADPTPPLPFGQSLVLGPAIFGTSSSFPNPTLFFHPQLQSVAIDTAKTNLDGTNSLLIRITCTDPKRSLENPKTNQIMELAWTLTLHEPSYQATKLNVAGTFEFTEDVVPDPVKTAAAESVRLLQVSTMYVDCYRHDVDAFRFQSAEGNVVVNFAPNLANMLLPVDFCPLDSKSLRFDSLHTDKFGKPNGDTPSYSMTIDSTSAPISGPITVRAFFNGSKNLNQDNLGLWAFQQPSVFIEAGAKGSINYAVIANKG